jgi:CubicO group peptidase (beta-lactamase class C family)
MRKLTQILLALIIALGILRPASPVQARVAQAGPTDPAEMEAFIDGYLAAQMPANHIAGVTVSVVQDGQVFFAKGYGYADIARQVPVDAEKTLFRVGSISKLFTWTAVMQLAEQGRLDLDADINTYLDFTIPATFAEPITLKHLLTHTPGFEDRGFGMAAATPERLIPNGEWLKAHIPARVRPPGQFSAYSNYGTALAGYIVERVAGIPFDQYIENNILAPLGMTHTTTRQPLPDALAQDMSQGYKFVDGAYEAQDFERIIVAPAGSVSASAADMARFMIAHLQNGRYGDAAILQEATARLMHSQLFTHDPRLTGMAYGFIEMDMNSQDIIGHGGDTAWFHSMLALLPEHNLGIFVSTNSEGGGNITVAMMQAFIDHYFPQPAPAITPPADFSQRAGRFTGSYRMNRMSYTTSEKIVALFSAIDIQTADDGMLAINTPFGKQRFVEIEPLVFRQVDGNTQVVFREDNQGAIKYGFYGLMPIFVLEKLEWYETPTFHFILFGVCGLLFLTILFAAPIGFFVNRSRPDRKPQPRLALLARLAAGGLVILSFFFLISFIMTLNNMVALLTGEAPLLSILPAISIVIALLAVGMVVFTVLAWKNRYWGVAGRIHYTLVTLAAAAFVWFLYFWNLLGKGV